MDSMKSLFERIGINDATNPMCDMDFLQFTVDCYNESEGDLDKEDGIYCNLCKNKGYRQVIEGKYAPFRKCKCMARREVFKKAKSSGLGEYLTKTLNDYIDEEDWQKRCKRAVVAYLEKHSHDNTWFITCGQSGCGKTLLCSIIANTLLVKCDREVMYIIWTDFIGKVKRDMMGEKTNEVSETMERVKNVDVLFIDEAIKKFNDTDLKYLIEIINYRYANDKKTIITSEKLMTEFLDIDEATFGRAVEKCEGFMINIPKDRTKNYRLRGLKI